MLRVQDRTLLLSSYILCVLWREHVLYSTLTMYGQSLNRNTWWKRRFSTDRMWLAEGNSEGLTTFPTRGLMSPFWKPLKIPSFFSNFDSIIPGDFTTSPRNSPEILESKEDLNLDVKMDESRFFRGMKAVTVLTEALRVYPFFTIFNVYLFPYQCDLIILIALWHDEEQFIVSKLVATILRKIFKKH